LGPRPLGPIGPIFFFDIYFFPINIILLFIYCLLNCLLHCLLNSSGRSRWIGRVESDALTSMSHQTNKSSLRVLQTSIIYVGRHDYYGTGPAHRPAHLLMWVGRPVGWRMICWKHKNTQAMALANTRRTVLASETDTETHVTASVNTASTDSVAGLCLTYTRRPRDVFLCVRHGRRFKDPDPSGWELAVGLSHHHHRHR